MALLTLGLNHTTAPVELREQVAFDATRLPNILAQLIQEFPDVRESAILSTCNRTELFLAIDGNLEFDIAGWLAGFHDIDPDILVPHIYRFKDLQAAKHMIRVASGLDSLVLGEPQILGQFKDAIRIARNALTCGTELEQAFSRVLSIAKRVRTETAIGRNPVSIAYASVNLANHIFSELSLCKVTLVGAGETIQLVAEHLIGQGVREIDVVNRTLANAKTLAASTDGFAWSLDELGERMQCADIVITSTGAPVPIIGKGIVERAQKVRRHKPMLMIDLAVPRDIEPEVAELESVYLYTVDDLKGVIEKGLEHRQEAARHAERLIDSALDSWQRDIRGYRAVDTIKQLREGIQELSEHELAQALRFLESGKPADEVLAQLSRNLTNKFLHAPTVAIRSAAEQGDLSLIEATNRLFRIDDIEDLD
ncbi:MAG: glutamyl-tRNA reductase [Pseudomonadota bacterium]|jgi:glutamyl-tRNA reductase